jgi:hypothetical protein
MELDRAGAKVDGILTTEEKQRAAAGASSAQNFTTNFYGPLKAIQLQQGSAGSSQSMAGGDLDGVAALVKALRESSTEIGLKDEDRRELDARLSVLEQELAAPRPNHWAMRAALSVIWTLGSGVASSYIAARHGIQIDRLLQSFMP